MLNTIRCQRWVRGLAPYKFFNDSILSLISLLGSLLLDSKSWFKAEIIFSLSIMDSLTIISVIYNIPDTFTFSRVALSLNFLSPVNKRQSLSLAYTITDIDHSAQTVPLVSLKWYRFVSVVTGIAFHVVGDTCLKSDSHVVIKVHEPWRWYRGLRCQAITKSTRLSLSSLTHRRSFQFDEITAV